MLDEKTYNCMMQIWNSKDFNKAAWEELQTRHFSDDNLELDFSYMAEFLRRQYCNMNIESIMENQELGEIIGFLNRLIDSKFEHREQLHGENKYKLSREELLEFKMLAEETSKITKEELSKTAPVLTTRTYLEMCRIAYDAIREWDYPEDISTAFLFCEARMWSYQHEYEEGILGIDWDLPEQFARRFDASYHSEELFFGGPTIVIHDESARVGERCYTTPKLYGQWTGYTYSEIYDKVNMYRTVKMYIALRKKGYPVYYHGYEKIVSKIRKD